jgi:GNAT superfamily N-acetyltransferase
MSTVMSRRLDQLTAAVENSVVFWTILAESRGDLVSTAPGVRAFNGPYTCRVIIDDPDRARAADVASIIEQTSAPVTVEDAFGAVDLTMLGLVPRQLPVMVREPGAPAGATTPPGVTIETVVADDALAIADRVIVTGFPVEDFPVGRLLGPSLHHRTEVTLARMATDADAAETVGACIRVPSARTDGIYWLTTLPHARSRGIGRALMNDALQSATQPVSLTASRPGRPLYESLGFRTISQSNWWTRPT